jgi:hypothetical protein
VHVAEVNVVVNVVSARVTGEATISSVAKNSCHHWVANRQTTLDERPTPEGACMRFPLNRFR